MPADAGIRFGQYVLLRRIARGGMAEVFLAQQRGLEGFDRRVAVKRILPHLADSQDFVKMFFGEAKLAAQLSHPNVVHIYEFGKVEHDYFIAMEFVDGVHAGQLFKFGEKEKLPVTLVARIGADAAAALHYAHELRAPNGGLVGLVHRDVSPANIMISFDGVVKLCDFGIAKAAAAGDQLTNPGQVKGKYAYMSPEQTIAAPLDGRSDVFSLAIVMWELLSGKYIVPRGDAVAAMRAIRDGKLDPIDKAAPGLPPTLAKAINWALEPNREKRATAAEFAQALEAFIKSSPELATPMQLGMWIRGRFPREATGQVAALGPGTGIAAAASPGTAASPSTLAAPGTQAGPSTQAAPPTGAPPQLPVTPGVYPPRRVVKLLTDTGEGTEIYSASDLDDESAETIKGQRKSPFAKSAGDVDADDARAAAQRGGAGAQRKGAGAPSGSVLKGAGAPAAASSAVAPSGSVLKGAGAPARGAVLKGAGAAGGASGPTIGASAASPFAPAGTQTVIEAPPPSSFESPRARDDEPTHFAAQAFGEETEIVRNAPPAPDEEDSLNVFETFEHDRRTPIPSGPLAVPTRLQSAQSSASGARPLPLPHGAKPGGGAPNPMPAPGSQSPGSQAPFVGAPGSQPNNMPHGAGLVGGSQPNSLPGGYAGAPGSQPNLVPGAYVGAPGSQPNLVPGAYGGAPGSRPNAMPQGPGAYIGAPLGGSSANPALPVPLSGVQPMQGRPRLDGAHGRSTPLPPQLVRRRRQKRLIAIGGLAGLMLLSFVIALAASSGGKPAARATVREDAGVASRADAAVLPIAPPPPDAGSPTQTPTVPTVPTVPDDAETAETSGDAYLEVRTIPDGGTVKVGDQVRVATADSGNVGGGTTAQLVLQAGDFDVIAELAGYQPEKRRVHLMRGEHQKIEIAFTKKIEKRPDRGPPTGTLSVRTTPWSDVYNGSKKLGQAPFADLELAAGTYTLTFKNPSRPVVTKTVKITAGKSQKLNFNLP